MKKSLITLVLIFAIFSVIGVWYYVTNRSPKEVVSTNQNPFASTTTGTSVGNGPTIQIQGTDGSQYTIPDPTIGKKFDKMTDGTYYQLTNNQETLGSEAQFEIVYGTDNSIQIGLTKEPLKQSRLAAEKQLRVFFPLADEQLCKLNVFLGVPAQVNETFAGQNLGLSFCPGAVKLP